jgi:hypothetical protein
VEWNMMSETKVMVLLRAAEANERVVLERHWRRYLETLIGSGTAPALRRAVYNRVNPGDDSGATDHPQGRWDAVVEMWFDNPAKAMSAIERMRTDLKPGSAIPVAREIVFLPVEERLIHESGERPLEVKILVFFKRRPDLTRSESQAYWHGPHARLGMTEYRAADFVKRYFQNHVLHDYVNPSLDFDYDGSPEYWMAGPEMLGLINPDSEVMKAIARDEENFTIRSSIVYLLVDEVEIYVRDPDFAGWTTHSAVRGWPN